MKKLIVYATLAMVLIVGSYQLVFAKQGNGSSSGTSRGCTSSQTVGYVEKLKLTDDQIGKINTLIQKDNTSSKFLHEKMQASMNSLREMEWSKNFVLANAEKLIKDRDDARATLQTNQQKLYEDIKALLTADQQKLFGELGFSGCGNGSCSGDGSCDGSGEGNGSGNGCGKGKGKGCGRN
jgi:Spy/CpxP family protein refolding chaperone